MVLKITLKNHYEAISHVIFVFIALLTLLFYFFHRFEYHPAFIIAFSIGFVFYEGGGLYLHIEYWLRNKGEGYRISEGTLIRVKGRQTEVYTSRDIDRIVVYMSPNMYKNWYLRFFAMEQYHYARVFLKNGRRLYITCLLAPRVDKALSNLEGVRVEKRQWLFNSTYIPESWY